MRFEWRREVAGLALLASMFLASAVLWGRVPQQIRGLCLVALPVVALFGWALYAVVVPRTARFAADCVRYRWAYDTTRHLLVASIAILHAAVAFTAALGALRWIDRIVFAVLGVDVAVFGFLCPKLQPNSFLGIVNRWTLRSEAVWHRTHRAARPLLVVLGLDLAAFGSTEMSVGLIATAVFGFAVHLILYLYSRREWKREQADAGKPTHSAS